MGHEQTSAKTFDSYLGLGTVVLAVIFAAKFRHFRKR